MVRDGWLGEPDRISEFTHSSTSSRNCNPQLLAPELSGYAAGASRRITSQRDAGMDRAAVIGEMEQARMTFHQAELRASSAPIPGSDCGTRRNRPFLLGS